MSIASRPLSPLEIQALPKKLGAAVNLDRMRLIAEAHPISRLSKLVGLGPRIVVRGTQIFWPKCPDTLSQDSDQLAILAHELVHVWQYQRGMNALTYLWRERGQYRYQLEAGKAYQRYGYEQQAAMVEDWVRLLSGLGTRFSQDRVTTKDLEAVIRFD